MATTTPTVSCAAVAAHYDDLDRFYREVWGEHVHHGLWTTRRETPEEATGQLIAVVAEEARVRPGDQVCDIGCGYGGTARVLARDYGAAVTALTISAAQHAYARSVSLDADNPTYLLRDWLRNDLPSETFHAAVAIESSEHMPDLAAFYSEAARVLQPHGKLVLCAWMTRAGATSRERNWLITPICREGRMRGMDPLTEHHRLARTAGLVPSAVKDISHQVQKTWSICVKRVIVGLLREPSYRRFLVQEGGPNRIFALTLLRIRIAYALGTMRYGVLTFVKN